MSDRLRFAPSPTGSLHVGGARTALFNWLYARHYGGQMLLRIEDTDKARSTDESTRAIFEGLQWLGLTWDEDVVHQGANLERHRRDAFAILESGKAYRCYCTPAELDERRREAERRGEVFRYDGRCGRLEPAEIERRLASGDPFTIRFRVPEGETSWNDLVHDTITFPNKDVDDFVILRSDETPIYNLAVVSDDIAMGITLVMRGDDHISNTPKQILLYRALGASLPRFAHLPMIHGIDGKKLSKRHGATAVGDYQDRGILPAAMRNFLALLGWSPGGDREILAEAEMIELFSLEGIQRKPAVFDTAKLEWMNGQYLSALPAEALLAPVGRELGRLGVVIDGRDLRPLVEATKARARTVTQIAEQVAVRLDGGRVVRDEKGEALVRKLGPAYGANLAAAVRELGQVAPAEWTAERLIDVLKAAAERDGLKLGDLLQPVRVALTGGTVSEPVNELLHVVGRDASLARLEAAARAG